MGLTPDVPSEAMGHVESLLSSLAKEDSVLTSLGCHAWELRRHLWGTQHPSLCPRHGLSNGHGFISSWHLLALFISSEQTRFCCESTFSSRFEAIVSWIQTYLRDDSTGISVPHIMTELA